MLADLERKVYLKRDIAESLEALGSLQSNAASIESWRNTVNDDKEASLQEAMRNFLQRLNVNVGAFPCIHVTGTKGKGSTCAFVESILRRGYGLKTGLFTSPNLVHVRERIRLDGKAVPEDIYLEHFWYCWDRLQETKSEEHPSMPAFFRFLTLLGFRTFEATKVDVGVIEVGIGGRTDATNVIVGEANGVATIGYDHCNVLGPTLTHIAYEKSGIFKAGKAAITSPQTEEVMTKLTERAKELQASTFYIAPSLESYGGDNPELGLDGEFQRSNAALAISLCKEFLTNVLQQNRLPESAREKVARDLETLSQGALPQAFREALAATKWPGRGQTIHLQSPDWHDATLFVDGAHTKESVEVCAQWFKAASNRQKGRNVLVFNCNKTKDAQKMLEALVDAELGFELLIFTTFETHNSLKVHKNDPFADPAKHPLAWQESNSKLWDELRNAQKEHTKDNAEEKKLLVGSIPEVFEEVKRYAAEQPDSPLNVLVTGSLYLVGGVLEVLIADGSLSESVIDL